MVWRTLGSRTAKEQNNRTEQRDRIERSYKARHLECAQSTAILSSAICAQFRRFPAIAHFVLESNFRAAWPTWVRFEVACIYCSGLLKVQTISNLLYSYQKRKLRVKLVT